MSPGNGSRPVLPAPQGHRRVEFRATGDTVEYDPNQPVATGGPKATPPWLQQVQDFRAKKQKRAGKLKAILTPNDNSMAGPKKKKKKKGKGKGKGQSTQM